MVALEVLYEDEHYLAVHKPAGLLIHRTSMARAKEYLVDQVRAQCGADLSPVHRLDRATSGVVMFARGPAATERMQATLASPETKKLYHAVVRGWIEQPGTVDYALNDKDTGKAPRPAVTHYRPLARAELPFAIGRYKTARYTLLEAELETGRRHQIRRHLKHIHHPIVGDKTHGRTEHNRFFRDHLGCERLLLFAVQLSFCHPLTRCWTNVHSAVEPERRDLLERLGWGEFLSRRLAGVEGQAQESPVSKAALSEP